jgi:sugar phosphate isomerase/epimerase
MKVALYTISYDGTWYASDPVPLKQLITKVAEFGYDGISLSSRRPHASPLDLDKKSCDEIKELANSLDLELVALDTYSNFMDPVMEHREAQLVWLRELIRLADKLDIKIVKVFAGWMGTTLRNGKGAYDGLYRLLLPYATDLERWNWIKEGIGEGAKWADEYGITLALQTHGPPVRPGYEDTLAMIREINSDRVKMCLDIGIGCFDQFTQQSDEYIAKSVRECRDLIVFSHYNGKFRQKANGDFIQEPYDSPGQTPTGGSLINYEAFVRELKKIGYNGHLAYEVCAIWPVLVNHQLQGIEEVDRLVKAAFGYMRKLIEKS